MEVLGKLGIDVKLLVAQIVNFGLLLLLLRRFVYRPILERIEADEAKLEDVKRQQELLDRQRQDFEENKRKEIWKMHKRASEIVKEAEDIAEDIRVTVQQEIEDEKKKVVKQIKSRLKSVENAKRK